MKQGLLSAIPAEFLTFRPFPATLGLFQRNGFHTHGVQTRSQKSCAEPLAIDLAIYLAGRLVDSQFLKHSRELFVTDATPHHLNFNELLRGLLPSIIRLSRPPTLAFRRIHHFPSAFERPLLISCRHSLTTIFSRIRLMQKVERYTFLPSYFLRTRMLRATSTDQASIQLPSWGGPK